MAASILGASKYSVVRVCKQEKEMDYTSMQREQKI